MPARLFAPSVAAALLAGCAGHVADYVGDREAIVAPQIERFGLNLRQTQCVANRLTQTLTPRQLRFLNRQLRDVRRGYYDPDRLMVRDLIRAASGMADNAIGLAMVRATASCDASPDAIAASEVARFMAAMPPTPPRRPAWLSLGAAPSGQAIAIDGATLEQQGTTRTAWFRLIDPPPAPANQNTYRLRIDCAARTINSLARRRQETDGRVSEFREYPDNPLPVEGGTVMEIAFLSLCQDAPAATQQQPAPTPPRNPGQQTPALPSRGALLA
ncbi:hypothetical protein [Sphingosinicella sp.]|uniref:hypothetical protein n=1 Tax=Sphingosinicella sp. TaxID=1917971 RepID=UPI00403821E4